MKYDQIAVARHDNNWQLWNLWIYLKLCNGIHLKIDSNSDIFSYQLTDLLDPNAQWDRINKNCEQYQTIWILDLCDISDNVKFDAHTVSHNYDVVKKLQHEHVILITQNFAPITLPEHVQIIRHNLLFNRSKLYYTINLDSIKQFGGYQPWYYDQSSDFHRPDIPKEYVAFQLNCEQRQCFRTRKILFAARSENAYRDQIFDLLVNQPDCDSFYKQRRLSDELKKIAVRNYNPFPADIYARSYTNVYNETNMANHVFHVTEKTIEPALRFQMLLPLASKKFLENLHSIGLKIIPDLIKYPWDHINEPRARTHVYCHNLQWLLSQPLDWFAEVYWDNLGTTMSNHQWLFDQPYCQNIRQVLEHAH